MIRLKKFEPADFQQLINWIDTEELMTNWAGNLFSFPLTVDKLNWYLCDTNVNRQSDAFIYKAINDNEETIGHISLGSVSWKNRSARVTRVLVGSHEHKGKGFCCQMMQAVLKMAFEELDLHRVSLGVYTENIGAIRCYEKSGFKIEGIHRDVMWYRQRWWSMIEMAVLQPEWKQLSVLNLKNGVK